LISVGILKKGSFVRPLGRAGNDLIPTIRDLDEGPEKVKRAQFFN
jgi:hypothetical protein